MGQAAVQDASRFARLPGQVGQYHLVVTLDDATSAIYSAFLVAAAGTLSSFRGIAEVSPSTGCFASSTPTGAAIILMLPTPARRSRRRCALRWPGLGPARHPPHCRVLARSPRPFRARLSNPLGPPAQGAGLGGDRHHRSGQPLAKAVPACILCLQEERRVGNDNTVKWRGLSLQIRRAHCEPISCPFRSRGGARTRVSRRAAGDLPWSTPLGRIRTRWITA